MFLTIFIIFLTGYFTIGGLLLSSPYRYTTQTRESDDQKNLHTFFQDQGMHQHMNVFFFCSQGVIFTIFTAFLTIRYSGIKLRIASATVDDHNDSVFSWIRGHLQYKYILDLAGAKSKVSVYILLNCF